MIFDRAYDYWNRNTINDFVRKCILYLFIKLNQFNLINKMKAHFYFRNSTIRFGNNIKISGFSSLVIIGNDCAFYDNSIFEFNENSNLTIGNNCIVSYGVLIACKKRIIIGNDVQIGEYSSIRDTTHDYSELGLPMKYNPDISKEIIIGNNVWIGRGCIILPGTIIEDGVVIGANSVVRGHLKADNIYAGTPLKFIKNRK